MTDAVTDLFIHAPDRSVAVIAEAGVNHNGDLDLAHRLVDVAVNAGASAVKFQTFDPDSLTAASARLTPYQRASSDRQSQAEMLRDLMLPPTAWRELKSHADERGIRFLSTPFDLASAEMLIDLGVDALKLSSGELTNLPFLARVANFGLPLLLSTGMGSRSEVMDAVRVAAAAPAVAVFHCVSAYPAPLSDCNLRAIPALHTDIGRPIGWSDHTDGAASALVAVAMGTRLLEKHFTLDRSLPGPDHRASLEPDDLAVYVDAVRAVPAMMGDGVKRRMPSEEENAPLVRRSWHAALDVPAGHRLTEEDVVALRPESGGLPPTVSLVGALTRRPLRRGQGVRADDVDRDRS